MTRDYNILFAIRNQGVTEMDRGALSDLAKRGAGVQPFFANAILRISDMLANGELAGVSPNDLFIGIAKKT